MFRGSPGLDAGQLSALIAAMGGSFNANTQQSVTQYFFSVPVEDLEHRAEIEAMRMRGLTAARGPVEQGARRHRTGSRAGLFEPHVSLL